MGELRIPMHDLSDLSELIRYNPDTGKMYWKHRGAKWFTESNTRTREHAANNWNSRYAGKEAFTFTTVNGYRQGALLGVGYQAHRVAWAIHYGEWPCKFIDHINGNRCDNRIENLRLANNSENLRNRGLQSNNTSGHKGVSFCKKYGKWRVRVKVNSVEYHIGYFDNICAASLAYDVNAKRLHKEFVKMNRDIKNDR